MPEPSLKARVRNSIQYTFFWLSARKDVPKSWFRGGFSNVKLIRFSLVVFALLNFSAVALGSTVWNSATPYSLWLGFASAAYIIIAIVYLLGLRAWYGPSSLFLVVSLAVNYLFNSGGGPVALSQSASPWFNGFIVLTWVYLVVVGLLLMRYDRGSRLNDLLVQS